MREPALSPRNTAEFNAQMARFAVSKVREKRTRRWYKSFSEEVPFARFAGVDASWIAKNRW